MASSEPVDSLLRLSASLTDENFSSVKLQEYQLLLSLNNSGFRIAVADAQRNKLLVLEDYELGKTYSLLQVAEQFRKLCARHAWLNRGIWGGIRLELHLMPYTLLPESLFDPAEAEDYFSLTGPFDPDHEQMLHYRHKSLDMVVLFSASKFMLEAVQQLKSRAPHIVVPAVSAFMEGLLHTQPRTPDAHAFILLEPQHATLTLMRDGTVLFCNTFYFSSPEDFIYYVILVMQEHQLNPEQDPVTVWGELTPDSALFSILQKYIRHVNLGKRPGSLHYSYRLEEQFPHRYFDLYSLFLCNG